MTEADVQLGVGVLMRKIVEICKSVTFSLFWEPYLPVLWIHSCGLSLDCWIVECPG